MAETTVSELSVNELKELIRDVVRQTFAEMFHDPDEGLELREAFKLELQHALSADKPEETVSADEVAAKLGLTW